MQNANVQALIDQELENAVGALEVAKKQGAANLMLARAAGGVAELCDRPDLVSRIREIVAGFTIADLLGGAITNIDLNESTANRQIELFSGTEANRQHPLADDAFVIEHARSHGGDYVRLCFAGDVAAAERAANDAFGFECIAFALVLMNQPDQASAFIRTHPVRDTTESGLQLITLLEQCRRASPGFERAIGQVALEGWHQLHVVLALAGRLPWLGYPFADY